MVLIARSVEASGRRGAAAWRSLGAVIAVVAASAIGAFMATVACAQSSNDWSPSAACPNEGIRVQEGTIALPDCRAYEMVTPPYKEGFGLFSASYASNGDSAMLVTLGGLAGAAGSTEYPPNISNIYRDERGPTGWELSPLNAPNAEFTGQMLEEYEADNGDTLWIQHAPSQSASHGQLYVRSPGSDPEYRRIGPDKPTETYEEEASNAIDVNPSRRSEVVAATPDFTHIALRAVKSEARWEFDETVGGRIFRSLYEYSGVGNEQPILVGVSGEKGSDRLISKCGTLLGSDSAGSAYNALSSDGEAAFFTTMPCNPDPPAEEKEELYARLHGALISPLPATTVDISASVCASECGEKSGMNFEGASEVQDVKGASGPDATEKGDRVFFTSTQKLTNDAVDRTAVGDATQGACADGGCNLYEYRLDEAVPASARLRSISHGGEVLGVMGIAEDGSHIYYISSAEMASAGANVYGKTPLGGQPNLYVYDTVSERTAFVATLSPADKQDWQRRFTRPAQVAGATGRFVLFASQMQGLTPDETSTQTQLYEYKAEGEGEAAELIRVTKGEDGYNEDGNGVQAGVEIGPIESAAQKLDLQDLKSTTNRLNISTDGRTIAFRTAGQLSPRAVSAEQGCQSVYEFHTPTGALSQGVVGLISDGRDAQASGGPGSVCGALFQGMDSTGANILFGTADPLLSSDVDGSQVDLYDARIDGGFPLSPEPAACMSLAGCEGAPLSPIGSARPGSSIQLPETLTPTTGPATGRGVTGKHVSSADGLSRALRACRKRLRNRHGRTVCERNVRRRYATAKTKGKRR